MTRRLGIFLRGDADEISAWLAEPGIRWEASCALVILIGSRLCGFTVGLWRAPLQSLYTAPKFPLLVFLTGGRNALLNGMLRRLGHLWRGRPIARGRRAVVDRPAKLAIGTLLFVLICLPSLYLSTCLRGTDMRIRMVASALFASVCLSSLFPIGPGRVDLSQSTDFVAFMGALHLLFWMIGMLFELRLLGGLTRFGDATERAHLKTWALIFIAVCLQMTTTLRPIVGQAEDFLPSEKQFFLPLVGVVRRKTLTERKP